MFKQLAVLAAVFLQLQGVRADPNYRLNSPFTPIHYSIAITPYFDTNNDQAFTFDGEVSIVLETNKSDVNTIRLHAEDLEFDETNILITSDSSVINLNPEKPIEFIKNYTFVDINLEAPLETNVPYTLDISYKGPIRKDLYGFYKSSYVENGITKWIGATQMESTHARKVFPCFDEPQYKATFTLTIDRPENYSPCLANTKLQNSLPQANGYIRDIFYPTPKMSTYLVAFMVSEFEAAEYATNGTREFGVYTRPEAKSQATYAFDFGKRVEAALSEYLMYDYYSSDTNLKLDHVALPDFRAGAMENWGLVKYREASLLYVADESTPYYRQRVAQIVAHETTHMWFGNLVTCHWWSNTWLNEGFANYLQDYITSLIEPDVGSADQLVIGSVYSAYAADESPSAPAITNEEVNSPSEINDHFGTITYQKAGSVIRMMHHFIGDDAFKAGLNTYLTINQFDVGYPNYLYDALDKATVAIGSLEQYPDVTIAQVMNSWISQAGHPVLEVDVNYDSGIVNLNQRRFYTVPSNKTDEVYQIPITYTTAKNVDFENTRPVFVMTEANKTLNVSDIEDQSWILFNIQETGFYRVNYDTKTWSIIAKALIGDERSKIHHLNRAKIVNDLFAFLTADEVQFNILYEVLDFLKNETEYAVWNAAINGLNSLRTRFIGNNDVLSELNTYILGLMNNVIQHLGYAEKSSDTFVERRNRMQVLEFACKLGHQDCVDNAVALFQRFKENGTKISPSLRPMAYCNGLRHGIAEDFDFLWNQMLTTNVANEALIIESALGCTMVQTKQEEYLGTVTKDDTPIRWQDVTVPLTSILADHDNADLVFHFLESNYSALKEVYPSISSVVRSVASALHTNTQFEKFETWLNNCSECSEEVKESGKAALTTAKAQTKWATDHRSDIIKVLRNSAVNIAPSVTVIAVSCLLIISKIW